MIKCFSKHVILISLITLFIAGCCNPPPESSLQVTLHPQETGQWCWAASGQMVMEYLGHKKVSQCVQANDRFLNDSPPSIVTDCPCDGSNLPEKHSCVIQRGLPDFRRYGFSSEQTFSEPLSWDRIKEQIYCKKKPFVFSVQFEGGGGHMMVVSGYRTQGGKNYVYILDPEPICTGEHGFESYDVYNAYPGVYTHGYDYYDITYTGDN